MEQKHTALPKAKLVYDAKDGEFIMYFGSGHADRKKGSWKIIDEVKLWDCCYKGELGFEASKERASQIVRAWNSHYDLLEKSKALCAQLVNYRNRDGVPHNAFANAAYQDMQTAIKKAEGKSHE